jgi:hypothetical protein
LARRVEKDAMGPLLARVCAAGGLSALALLPGACTTTSSVDPVGLTINQPVHCEALRAWRFFDERGTHGYAVLFGDPQAGEADPRSFYSVRNAWQQELGTIDGLGRAWRFVPHQREADWVFTGSVLDGVRAILVTAPQAQLEEIPLAALGGPGKPSSEPGR